MRQHPFPQGAPQPIFGTSNVFGGGAPSFSTPVTASLVAQGSMTRLELASVDPGTHGSFSLDNGQNGTLQIDGRYSIAATAAARMMATYGRR